GRAIALEYASQGAFIGLTARSEGLLTDLLGEIEAAGGRGMVLAGDVTDREAMARLAGAMQEQAGGIDILLANAGSHAPSDLKAFDVDQYMGLMTLNYAGALNCIQAVLPGMLHSGTGHIVGVASLAGYRGVPSAAAYGASKAALIHFLESMRFDIAHQGIKVTIVNPGFVRTPLTDKNNFHMPFLVEPEKAARIICKGIDRGRKEITFPFLFASFIKMLRILPMPIYAAIMGKVWKRMQQG
ncbi:MAG: SDR family NAD(P)-dependent oxidoreductase, partial [Phycisphaerales bacterium]|nr:SDR family NAD(P)-dependent oxidoreductase [Phycisphaerales bacterium]